MQPAAEQLRRDPDSLPSLRRLPLTIHTLQRWAAEFNGLEGGRYTASEFVEWLALEAAPPVLERKDECIPVYTLVGDAALALRG